MLCLLITPKFINEFDQKGKENTFLKRTLAYMGNTLLDNGLKYVNEVLSQMFNINTDDVSQFLSQTNFVTNLVNIDMIDNLLEAVNKHEIRELT